MDSRCVVFLVFDDVKALDVAGAAEVFAEANRHGAGYRIEHCSPAGTSVGTSIGLRFDVSSSGDSAPSPQTLVVCGGDDLPGRPIDPSLVEAARALAARAERIVSICTGAFVLAEAGLLDGRRATTHWRHAALLGSGHPRVSVEPDAIFVRDGNVCTSAGVSAGIDLALALVEEDHGPALARAVARDLVVYLQRAGSQSQFSAPMSRSAPRAAPLRRALESIDADPAAEHSTRELAQAARVSERHLSRLFRREKDLTPAGYVEGVRLDLAKAHLDAGAGVAEAAAVSGFGSAETMRRVFSKRLGLSPSAYRQRFHSAADPADAREDARPGR